jgi:hypothetical protein
MSYLKEQWLNILFVAFLILLPWQTRFIYGFIPLAGEVSEYGVLSLYASEMLFILGLVGGYVFFGTPLIRAMYKKPLLVLIIFAGFVFLSSLFSREPSLSMGLFLHLSTGLLFFTALLDERVSVKKILLAFVLGLLVPVFLGITQVLTDGSDPSTLLGLAGREASHLGDAVIVLADGTRVLRAYGSFPHPNIFGGFLSVGVIVAMTFLKKVPDSRLFDRSRILYVLLMLTLFSGLLLTASRSALLGLALALTLSFILFRLKGSLFARKVIMPVALLIIGGSLALSILTPKLISGLRGGGTLEAKSLEERSLMYGEFPDLLSPRSVILGNGWGAYVFADEARFPGREVYAYQPIHNVPLLAFAEVGLPGVMLLLIFLFLIDSINFSRFPNEDAVAAFAMGSILLTVAFFDHYLWSSWAGIILTLFVLALTLRLGEEHRSS